MNCILDGRRSFFWFDLVWLIFFGARIFYIFKLERMVTNMHRGVSLRVTNAVKSEVRCVRSVFGSGENQSAAFRDGLVRK